MYTLTNSERETTITWDAEDKTARIFTADPATMRKLDKLTEEFPEVYRCIWVDDKYPGKKYEVYAWYIRFGKPASEAQKEKAARMREIAKNRLIHKDFSDVT